MILVVLNVFFEILRNLPGLADNMPACYTLATLRGYPGNVSNKGTSNEAIFGSCWCPRWCSPGSHRINTRAGADAIILPERRQLPGHQGLGRHCQKARSARQGTRGRGRQAADERADRDAHSRHGARRTVPPLGRRRAQRCRQSLAVQEHSDAPIVEHRSAALRPAQKKLGHTTAARAAVVF